MAVSITDSWTNERRRGKSQLQAAFREYCQVNGEHIETTISDGMKTEKYRMPSGKMSWIVSRATDSDNL